MKISKFSIRLTPLELMIDKFSKHKILKIQDSNGYKKEVKTSENLVCLKIKIHKIQKYSFT